MPDCSDDCQKALARLEEFLDGELADADIEDIRQHLSHCYPCADRASFEEQLRAVIRRGCVESVPPTLISRIESRLFRDAGFTDT